MSERDVLDLVRERLSKVFEIERMVLFGSRARGTASEESDYDVLVVAESDLPFVKRQGAALLSLGARDFSIDLLVYTPQEYERARAILGSAAYWAEREGKVINA